MSTPIAGRPADTEAVHPLGAAFAVLARHWRVPEADVGPIEPGFVPTATLFANDAFLGSMLARQQASTPGLDAKGAAAYLVTEYAGLIGIAAAVPFLSHGAVPDFDPTVCALAFEVGNRENDEEQAPPRVRLRFLSSCFATDRDFPEIAASALRVDHPALCERLRLGIEAHFSPLIERLTLRTKLPRRAMWRLVADAVAVRFLEAGRRLGCEATAKADALAVLKAPGSPLANPQMHFFDIVIREDAPPRRVLAERTFRARGGCCRYYTVPGGSLCSTCVLLDARERDSKLEARMRHQLGLPAADGAHGAATP